MNETWNSRPTNTQMTYLRKKCFYAQTRRNFMNKPLFKRDILLSLAYDAHFYNNFLGLNSLFLEAVTCGEKISYTCT
eukprot:snap_masked-scaffold_6-processed-gene-4.27-mRNA-1 protein AED:1.00 eAED:1.00 QI:0/0/0/0/1/1/2/0/76